MKWITREHAKVDRIACPWLIKNFVDSEAKFLFIPSHKVLETMRNENAIPFDIPNVELGHHDDECSFDSIIKKYQLDKKNPELLFLAEIVRGADTEKDKQHLNQQGLQQLLLVLVLPQKMTMIIWKNNFLYMMHYMHLLKQTTKKSF